MNLKLRSQDKFEDAILLQHECLATSRCIGKAMVSFASAELGK